MKVRKFIEQKIKTEENPVERILAIYERLSALPKLDPSPETNRLFNDLITIVLEYRGNAGIILTDERIRKIKPKLEMLCADGEYLLEEHWVKKIIANTSASDTLKKFPYYANYQKLLKTEYSALVSAGILKSSKILFVGSGPLPLSSILLATEYGLAVTAIDNEKESVCLAEELITTLSLSDRIRIIHGDIRDYKDLDEYDAVLVAAFAGSTESDKKSIVRRTVKSLKENAVLIARSVADLSTLFYCPVNPAWLNGITISEVIHPADDVINSVIIGRKSYE